MVQLNSQGSIVYMEVQNILTLNDFDQMEPLVRKKINEYTKIRLYFEMRDYRGWTFRAFWRDIYMDLKYRNKVEKIAMVGDKTWERWLSIVIRPFSGAQVRFYDLLRKEDALA